MKNIIAGIIIGAAAGLLIAIPVSPKKSSNQKKKL
jgi:gas vesicle protein